MTSLSTYDFTSLYTYLPHNLINDKLIDLIEKFFQREGSPYQSCNERDAFFTTKQPKNAIDGPVKMYVMRWHFCWTSFLYDFGTKLYRQVVLVSMGTNYAPLVADFTCVMMGTLWCLFLIDAFYTTSRYLDDILNINNIYFDNMVIRIYH